MYLHFSFSYYFFYFDFLEGGGLGFAILGKFLLNLPEKKQKAVKYAKRVEWRCMKLHVYIYI